MTAWTNLKSLWLDRAQPASTPPTTDWDRICPGSYLVIRRSIAQSMPEDWQRDMARLYRQMVQRCHTAQVELAPTVTTALIRGEHGHWQRDPLASFAGDRNPFTEGGDE